MNYRRGLLSKSLVAARLLAGLWLATAPLSGFGHASPGQAQPAPSVLQAVGTIKAISDGGFTLSSDAGEEFQVSISESARLLRVAPGQKDLKTATPLQKQDLQVGDRVLARGRPSGDSHAIDAAAVIVMKQTDVAAKHDKDREDWQKRGIGGLVTAVDAGSGSITVSQTSFAGSKSSVVHVAKSTILRRYAPNSVKFDEAKVAPLDQIKVGDQLRARGSKNEDGTELTADEVVSGTFRNLSGTITAIDPSASSLTLKDLLSKQTFVVKVTGDAQLRKLPPEFAQRIAMRLKGAAAAGIPGAAAALPGGTSAGKEASGRPQQGTFGPGQNGGAGGFSRNGGPPDIQQILSRMPAATLSDLQKGDAVMIVTTQGNETGEVNAITLLAGVEPLLTASPSASQAMMLSPWSLSSSSAEAAANP